MYCMKCGTQLEEGRKRCPLCGGYEKIHQGMRFPRVQEDKAYHHAAVCSLLH